MKRLLIVAILVAAASQVQAGALGFGKPCSPGYGTNVHNASAVNAYTCQKLLGSRVAGSTRLACPSTGYLASKIGRNSYVCQRRTL